MPITQDRLLRLITAGEHFRDTASTLRNALNAKASQLFSHTITFEQAIAELSYELNTAVPNDALHASTLAEERTRYNITHKRNSIEKRRIYNKRHPLPTPPPQSKSIAQVAASIDSADESLQGLTDISDEFDTPSSSDLQAAITRALKDQ